MDEIKEIEEVKIKIEKDIAERTELLKEAMSELEYEQEFFSGDEALLKAKKKVEVLENELKGLGELEKLAQLRLAEATKKSIAEQNNKTQGLVPPFKLLILDLFDAYHYADVFDDWRYSWLTGGFAPYVDFDIVRDLADRLFAALNPNKKTQPEWYELDAGYDVWVYDKTEKCVYKAHTKLPEK